MSEVSLKQRAEEIRDETKKGANTSERVGGVLVDTVQELNDVKAKLDEFMGFTYIDSIEIPAEGGEVILGVKTTCKKWEVE